MQQTKLICRSRCQQSQQVYRGARIMFERLVAVELKQKEVEKEEVDNRPSLQDE